MKLKEVLKEDFEDVILEDISVKNSMSRPDTEVELNNIIEHCKSVERLTKDPTEDLVKLPYGLCKNYEEILNSAKLGSGYIVFDKDTNETWYAHDITCLNKNFIYREDLIIKEVYFAEDARRVWHEFNDSIDYSRVKSVVKYILEDPAAEVYEVYSDSSYVVHKYGKPVPVGLNVHKCANRFYRDMMILALDEYYSKSSKKQARELANKSLGDNEAIVVSDGAWLNNIAANSYYYLDDSTTIHFSEGTLPSDVKQGVVLAEVKGAYNALSLCYARCKMDIKYYYDNPNILNVLKSNKFKYIKEVQEYKRLLHNMHADGYSIEFIELHPKTGAERSNLNKALMYFHNSCDSSCEAIADICKRDYKKVASNNKQEGKTSSEIMKKECTYRKQKPIHKRY